jgi:hypothetical protein
MNTRRLTAVLALCIAGVAMAADPASADRSKDSPALLQAELAREHRRLDVAETELGLLKVEQSKVEEALRKVNDSKVDASKVRQVLEDFRRSFTALQGAISTNNRVATLANYDVMMKHLRRLRDGDGWMYSLPQWPYAVNGQWANAVMEELYGPESGRARSQDEDPFNGLDIFYRSENLQGVQVYDNIKDSVERAAGAVAALNGDSIVRAFERDHADIVRMWQAVAERAQSGVERGVASAKEAREKINSISTALETRKIEDLHVDARLNFAVLSMIMALGVLFIATRFFHKDIQAIIFEQRTLVEMVGLGFLLLTIIILGTDGKIDESVLGTLLGTVGGYIFGQQAQARRNAAADAQRSQSATTELGTTAGAPAQPVTAAPQPAPAQPVAAGPQPATLQPVTGQAAALLQQAAQQGGNLEQPSVAGATATASEGTRAAPPQEP